MRLAVSSTIFAGLMAAARGVSSRPAEAAYEVWACDQSNTIENASALGTQGSYIWIWDSNAVEAAVGGAESTPPSLPCTPDATEGPCNMLEMFPQELTDSVSGETLATSTGFGRWHGVTRDPQSKYVTANIFVPGGGYLGIVDTDTKEAVALFRVTLMEYGKPTEADPAATAQLRSNHMSFWSSDGSAILIHNLHGKALERVNVDRDDDGKITQLTFDKSATVGLGKGMSVVTEASFFEGNNAFGRPLIGAVTGTYDNADLGDLTPGGECKENGCDGGADDTAKAAGRPNNVPICPVVADNGLIFNTFGGGGLLVTDSKQTPMTIVGEHGNDAIYGAGVCGESVAGKVFFTSGNSASGAGITHSMWAMWGFHPEDFEGATETPLPRHAHEFEGTATGGRTVGIEKDESGQIPGKTTRRDAHDLAGTIDGKYIHVVDRIQDVIDVFDSETGDHLGSYSLISDNGEVENHVEVGGGPCEAASVTDGGEGFPTNTPGPDFIDPTPDGKYMMLSLRGPAPVSASHSAQGSCPGVGVVELTDGGKSGKMVAVLRSTNMIPDMAGVINPPGGFEYLGKERSDVHDVVVIKKKGVTTEIDDSAGPLHGSAVGALVGSVALAVASFC